MYGSSSLTWWLLLHEQEWSFLRSFPFPFWFSQTSFSFFTHFPQFLSSSWYTGNHFFWTSCLIWYFWFPLTLFSFSPIRLKDFLPVFSQLVVKQHLNWKVCDRRIDQHLFHRSLDSVNQQLVALIFSYVVLVRDCFHGISSPSIIRIHNSIKEYVYCEKLSRRILSLRNSINESSHCDNSLSQGFLDC